MVVWVACTKVICPGFVMTPSVETQMAEQAMDLASP
jgi:hypothetical protein